MTIHILAADHQKQGLDAVARLGSDATALGPLLKTEHPWIKGVLVLATCNRLAIYAEAPTGHTPSQVYDAITTTLATHTNQDPTQIQLTHSWDHFAYLHAFATAAGLESMVVGEREIAGQLRRASQRAAKDATLSCDLGRMVEYASAASRRVARETGLAGTGRSVVAVGIDLAAAQLLTQPEATVLIVGTGAYAGATVATLRERGVQNLCVYSNSGRAQAFADAHNTRAITAAQLPETLSQASLIITCRGLGTPILTRDLVAPTLAARTSPLTILDLALSRDVEESVGRLPGVTYYDLRRVQAAVPDAETQQIVAARRIVEEEVANFEKLLDGKRMDPLVSALRNRVNEIVQEELARLPKESGTGTPQPVPVEQVERALQHLAARLIHNPTVLARRAGEEGYEDEYRQAVELVLGLELND